MWPFPFLQTVLVNVDNFMLVASRKNIFVFASSISQSISIAEVYSNTDKDCCLNRAFER